MKTRVLAVIVLSALIALSPLSFARAAARACILDVSRLPGQAGEEQEWETEYWRNILRSRGIETSLLSPAELRGSLERFDLLVLPGAEELDSVQAEAVEAFLERGNSVIMTGRAGERNPDPGSETLSGALGLSYSEIEHEGMADLRVIFNTPSFLTAGIMPAQMIYAGRSRLYCRRDGGGLDAVAFWYNILDEGAGAGSPEFPAAAAGRHGAGRFLWTGFSAGDVGGDMDSVEAFGKMADNVLKWFSNEPVLEKNPWEGLHEVCVSFAQDTEAGFANTLDVLALETLPRTTFFLLTDVARLNERVMRKLADDPRAELAVHGDSHDVFIGQTTEKQVRRLEKARDFIGGFRSDRVAGFRPPEEEYDYYTLEALVKTGYGYVFADHSPARAAPSTAAVKGGRLVQFPMLNRDDIKIIVEGRLRDNDLIFEEYRKDIDFIFSLGGLYMFDFHSHVLAAERHIEVLEKVIDYVSEKGAWSASCGDIADWWRARENIVHSVTGLSGNFIEAEVSNEGRRESPPGVSFSLWFPSAVSGARARMTAGERRLEEFKFEDDRAVLVLPAMRPGESFRFRVTWEN